MMRYVVFSSCCAVIIFNMFIGCVLTPDGKPPKSLPTAMPSPKPRLTAIPPFPTPTPEPSPRPYILVAPEKADQCEKFRVSVKGPFQKDDIVIWAEKKFHIGRMFYDEKKDEKYLMVKLNTSGERSLDFTVNGTWQMTHKILIQSFPSNCNSSQ